MQVKPLFFLALGMRLFVRAQLETVTLFDIAGPSDIPNPNSFGISVVGVNSQGETTYVMDGVASLGLQVLSTTTQVFEISASQESVHLTFVEDASHIVESVEATASGEAGFAETCTWGSDGQGECVAVIYEGTTEFVTFIGTKNPATTLTVSVPTTFSTATTAVATTTANSNHTSARSSGVTQSFVTLLIVMILQVVGGFMVLF